jgi:MYXO-CTERM domain-containing protein
MTRVGCLLLPVLLAYPAAARAFSDYELFSLPPLEGGGGGRFYTTSSSDGYGCSVCHLGGPKPVIELRGLPEHNLFAGAAYDIELVWQAPEAAHALNLEFVTPDGRAAGSIVLPDPNTLDALDRCDAAHPEESATQLIEESAPRQVLWMNDCGARRLRFRYIASAEPRLMFAASIVRTDASEKPDGDGVTELRRELSLVGTETGGGDEGCSVRPHARAQPLPLALLALCASWLRRRRRNA